MKQSSGLPRASSPEGMALPSERSTATDTATSVPTPSLRRVLLTRWSLLVLGAMLLLSFAFFRFGFQPMTERIAEAQFDRAAVAVEHRLDQTFLPAHGLLGVALEWLARQPLDLEDPGEFNRMFMPVLRRHAQMTSVVAGTSSGQAWLLLQQEGGWRNRMTDMSRWGRRNLIIETDGQGRQTRRWEALDYDARQRPWYGAALAAGHPSTTAWTEPYLFYTTGEPGITASMAVRLTDGRDFVLGFDLKLKDLSEATMQARIGQRGLALVVTRDWRVLALPGAPGGQAGESWLGRVLQPVQSLGMPALDALHAAWKRHGETSDVFRFQVGAQPWLASVHAYPMGQQDLRVVTLAPYGDFIPDLRPVAIAVTGMLALILLVAFLIARIQSRAVAEPLEALARSSQRIGALDFSDAAPVASDIREIRQLADAQASMRSMLMDNQLTLSRQAEELQQQLAALQAADARLRESEAYNKLLFSGSRIPLVVLDPESGVFVDCNQAAVDIYRLRDRDDLLGRTPLQMSAAVQYDGTSSEQASGRVVQAALEEGTVVFEWRHRRPDGSEWDAEVHLMAFQYGEHTLLQFSLQDITERRIAADKLQRLAFYDSLTGLPNRSLLLDRLRQALATAQRHDQSLALLFLDLDRFKEINDTQGHSIGDQLLQAVAGRFQSVLRQEETMARMGGDEFVVLALGADQVAAAFIAERLVGALALPLDVAGHQFAVSVSVGIVNYPMDGKTPEQLLQHADVAMYRAKSTGGGYRYYRPEMSEGLAESMLLARDLKAALKRRSPELELYFQPQLDLSTGRLVGAEALMRWQRPGQDTISPAVFIPVAEERGMMLELGTWVLEEACRNLNTWQAQGHVLPGRLAVNVATQQIESPDFPEQAVHIVRRAGLAPGQFELELTESGLMRNVEMAINIAGRLKAAGFALAIDDFGTGYSSLAYLKRLPVSKVKIDISFVRDMLVDHNDYAIVSTIIAMGRTLDMKTLAEGVESPAQADTLLAMGCAEAQGFHFGQPVPAALFAQKWLAGMPQDPQGSIAGV